MNETVFHLPGLEVAKAMPSGTAAGVPRQGQDDAALKKAARDFEAVFINQLLKVMRETIEESGEGGLGKGIYTELFDQEIAVSMAERGALGIGDLIYKSLSEKERGEGVGRAPALSPSVARPRPAHRAHAEADGPAPETAVEAGPRLYGEGASAQGAQKASDPQDISDMMLPVHAPISSAFGVRRDPFTGKSRFHKGVDIAAPAGTPVVAALPGKVVAAGNEGGYGNTVMVEHEDGLRTRYAHLSSINVKVGDRVTSEDTLGTVGSTGRSTGAHLHFEVLRHGKPVNPLLSAK
ncbi:MAG: peptidoglycan DD-metalloendopeptidase family protein [Acidobacteriota bacterium]|nr:peptidoglycan DD-metalloendopeptidase family protein [Acidobacteriota bacterium]